MQSVLSKWANEAGFLIIMLLVAVAFVIGAAHAQKIHISKAERLTITQKVDINTPAFWQRVQNSFTGDA